MRKPLFFTLLIIVAAGLTPARAADVVMLFGISLGGQFTVAHCKDAHPISVKQTCWTYKFDPQLMPGAKEMRSLYFPNPTTLGYEITAFVNKDIMDAMTITTIGIRAQDYTMSQLTDKFGKPTQFKKVTVQNGMGAQFDVDRAVWDTSQYYVQFDADASDGGATEGRLDKGWISIETHEQHVAELKRRQESLKTLQKF